MDGTEYDVIVLGTGLKECILSGLLSVDGLKVLHLDRNGYYGGASASLNLNQLYEQHRAGAKPPTTMGAPREYNVDVVPKFIMAAGTLTDMLVHTNVVRYLEFKSIAGSYVYRGGKIYKVPATGGEALKSSLMGLFEKRRCQKFLEFCGDYEIEDVKSHNGNDLNKMLMKDLFKKFDLDIDTIEFLGHSSALYLNDEYLEKPALECVMRIKLYADSLARYSKSPYIYPLYGLGELPQAFARLSAIYGGTYMLNAPLKSIIYENGVAVGVISNEEGNPTAKCKFIVADPSYFPEKVKPIGRVFKVICILSHPVPNTDDSESTQIIIPQRQLKRNNDIYISVISSANCVAPKGKYIAIVATTAETANPRAEVEPAIKLLGPIDEQFEILQDVMAPIADGSADKVFISQSYDATSHFETTVDDVRDMYRRITGHDLVLKKKEEEKEPESKK